MKVSRLSLLFAFLCCGALASAETRPNVVVLLVDDLGYADVSCLANGAVRTPNLDRLAAMGVTFTSGYVTVPHGALFFSIDGKRAVRRGPWKLVMEPGGAAQLFDLSKDPAEKHDLAASEAQVVSDLTERWKTWHEPMPPPVRRKTEDPK